MTNIEIAQAADAIAQAGSQAFVHHAGATLEHLSELAKAGELEALSTMLLAHATLHPGDRRKLVDSVPAKIVNQYIYSNRKRSMRVVEPWLKGRPNGQRR